MKSFTSPLLQNTDRPLMLVNTRTGVPVALHLEAAFDSASRNRGLLGRDRLEPSSALIIAPCWSIHTFFMRFTIDVIFAAQDGAVRKAIPQLRPWRLAVGWGAYAVIELPAGTIDQFDIRSGDRLIVETRPATP